MTRILMLGALALGLLSACSTRRDDGMRDLWKGVACVQEGNCR